MTKEYYGCEIIPDNELGSRCGSLGLTDEQGLKFIKQLREITKSTEPLILVPTRKKGKTSSAATGSCHWAVKKLTEQHLGKMFTGYSISPNSSIQVKKKGAYHIDANYQHLILCYHSVWQTPEEKLVNVIDYKKFYTESTEMLPSDDPAKDTILNFYENFQDDYCLMLPTNEHMYYQFLHNEGKNDEIFYRDLYYTFERQKPVDQVKAIKQLIDWSNKNEKELYWLEGDRLFAYNNKSYPIDEIPLELLSIYECPYETFNDNIKNINEEKKWNEKYPILHSNAEFRIFKPEEVKKYIKVYEYALDNVKELVNKRDALLKKGSAELINTKFVLKDNSWLSAKDLFSKPSTSTRKEHFEITNHPLYDNRVEYRTVDKEVLNNEIQNRIKNMSESQLNYEKKRAEKKGITLEEHITKQKYKLVS